jgi:hypothetical protein
MFYIQISDGCLPSSLKRERNVLQIKSFVSAPADLELRRWFPGSIKSVPDQLQHEVSSPHAFPQLWQSKTVNVWSNKPGLTMCKGETGRPHKIIIDRS